jgi:hypothetical protein
VDIDVLFSTHLSFSKSDADVKISKFSGPSPAVRLPLTERSLSSESAHRPTHQRLHRLASGMISGPVSRTAIRLGPEAGSGGEYAGADQSRTVTGMPSHSIMIMIIGRPGFRRRVKLDTENLKLFGDGDAAHRRSAAVSAAET